MDTIIFSPAQSETTKSNASGLCPAADSAPPLAIVYDESWVWLEATPNALISCTPAVEWIRHLQSPLQPDSLMAPMT